MNHTMWVVLGATSIIAKEFAHLAAKHNHPLLLVGRDMTRLTIIANDLRLRYAIPCDTYCCDFASQSSLMAFITQLNHHPQELAFFIAHSSILENNQLTTATIQSLIDINITSTIQLIHAYLQKKQSTHRLIFLSSVAGCRGRTKNSLYGASKKAIEVYLQGLQQSAIKTQRITIARLGFIDTIHTYGMPGIFYASAPSLCANACWQAHYANKGMFYHPFFWRYIMLIIMHMPFWLYRRLGKL